MEIGRKIYYDLITGNVIVDTGERRGSVIETTIDQDIKAYKSLSERNRDTFDVIELPYGAYKQDFLESTSYRVNTETKELEFSNHNIDNPEEEPIFDKPLSEQILELEAKLSYELLLKDIEIEKTNASQADLMYQLMIKGVL